MTVRKQKDKKKAVETNSESDDKSWLDDEQDQS